MTTISLTCKRCGVVITAGDEDELVTQVQTHHDREHDGAHVLSRKQILARLHDQDAAER